ncbi:MAG: polysaccharide export protein, partial [Rhizorhabdus sp.]|nr:polysaccharide export protein [Rhizorhabdus sp.]
MALGIAVGRFVSVFALASFTLAGCANSAEKLKELPPAPFVSQATAPGEDYAIGPLDQLTIFI